MNRVYSQVKPQPKPAQQDASPRTIVTPDPSPYPSPIDYGWFNNEPPVRIRRGGGETET